MRNITEVIDRYAEPGIIDLNIMDELYLLKSLEQTVLNNDEVSEEIRDKYIDLVLNEALDILERSYE